MSAGWARRLTRRVALATVLLWPHAGAAKSVLADSQERAALVWQPLTVAHPAVLDAAGWPEDPTMVAATVAGRITVGPRRAARVRLAALAVARVRALDDVGVGLKFTRVTGAARVAELPTRLAPGTWLLEQPPGEVSEWLVTAATPTEIAIEGVRPRTGDLIWEHAIGSVLAWIDDGGDVPPLPEVADAEATQRALLADEEVAAAILRLPDADVALRTAVRAWRRAAAIQRLTALRAPVRSAFGLELQPKTLTEAEQVPLGGASGWQRVRGGATHVLALRGPGVLWIEGRGVGAGGEIRVASEGRRLAAASLRAPAIVAPGTGPGGQVGLAEGTGPNGQDEGVVDRRGEGGRSGEDVDLGAGEAAAVGRADFGTGARLAAALGEPVGPPEVVRVALAPGLHDYKVEFAGPDMAVDLRSGRTNLRLAAAVRGEGVATQVRRARRALRRTGSSRAPLVAALLATVEGKPSGGAGPTDGCVTLALAQAELAAQADGLSVEQQHALAVTLARRAARAPVGPLVWRARRLGLELAGNDGALARALVGSRPAEAPTEVLEQLANKIEGPPLALRSPAVALLELARRRAPLDAGLRAAYRDRWRTGTRWAALRADEAAGAGWTWIEPQPAADERVPGARALWRWPVGQPQVLEVDAVPAGRAALLRVYAQVPERSGAVGLVVGEQRWLSPVLASLERWQLALPPGRHQVSMTAPAGATLWASRAPRPEGAPDGHLLRMWPAGAGEAVRFVLPGGSEPAFVRVELRALGERSAASPVRVWVARDDQAAQAIDLRLPGVDPTVVPVQADDGLGGRGSVTVRVEAGTKTLTVRVAEDGPRVAISASIRATRSKDGDVGAAFARVAGGVALASEPPAPAGQCEVPEPGLPVATGADKPAKLSAGTGDDELSAGTGNGKLSAGTGAGELSAGTGVGELSAGTGENAPPDPVAFVDAAKAAGIDEQEDGPGLARLAALSRELQNKPDERALRLERAELLLDLDQPGYAYVDWQAVTAGGLPQGLIGPALALAERLDALDAPDTIDLTTSQPVVVGPALAAALAGDVASLNAVEPAVAAARTGGPSQGIAALDRLALDTSTVAVPKDRSKAAPAAGVLRATWLDERGEVDAAARVWSRVSADDGLWQAGLVGVGSFLAALDGPAARPGSLLRPTRHEPRAEGAALAYGLALSVRRTVRTPAVQRLATVAATRSSWSRVVSSERDAGVESLTVPRASSLPSPNAAVRQALVVPPWPHSEATLLRPGYATVLAVQREASELAVDAWCEEVRPGRGTDQAQLRVTLDGVDLLRGPVPARSVTGPTVEGLPAGRHRVEVELDPASRGHLCSVRLRDAAGTVGSVRPTTWRVARPGQPVEVVVLAPTTLAIEARALLGGGEAERGLQVSVGRGRSKLSTRAVLELSDQPDPQATPEAVRTIHPGVATSRVIAVAERGPHRVVLSTTGGAALIRLQQRVDGDAVVTPRAPVRSLDLGSLVDEVGPIDLPIARVPAVAAVARPVQRFGTLFAETHLGNDDLDGADDLQTRLSGSVRVGWARELLARRLWLQVAPELRPREGTAMTGGGGFALQMYFPRAGIRGRIAGDVLASQALGDTAWALRGAARVDRPTWVGRQVQLLPSIELGLRGQSLGPRALVAEDPIHPRIYTRYGATHPSALRPGLEVRWQRWQDARLYAGTDVVVNSDFKGLDQVNLRGGMVGVLAVLRRVVPEFAVEYEASVRLKDAFRSRTYVQNRIRAAIGFGLWAGKAARVVFGVSDTLFVSGPFPLRNVLDVWLRVDMVLGRGLRDYGPLDMAFKPVRERRLWLGGEGAP